VFLTRIETLRAIDSDKTHTAVSCLCSAELQSHREVLAQAWSGDTATLRYLAVASLYGIAFCQSYYYNAYKNSGCHVH